MLKFVLILSVIIIGNESRNIYVSGGLRYRRGHEKSKIYVVNANPSSHFNPIITECNRKKCTRHEVCNSNNYKCYYDSLCGHNICKENSEDYTLVDATTESVIISENLSSLFTSDKTEATTTTTTFVTETSISTSVETTPTTTSQTTTTEDTIPTTTPETTTTPTSTTSTTTSQTTTEVGTTPTTVSETTTTLTSTILTEIISETTNTTLKSNTMTETTDIIFSTTVAFVNNETTILKHNTTTETTEAILSTTIINTVVPTTETETEINSSTTESFSSTVRTITTNDDIDDDDNDIIFIDENGSGSGDGIKEPDIKESHKNVKKEVVPNNNDFSFIDQKESTSTDVFNDDEDNNYSGSGNNEASTEFTTISSSMLLNTNRSASKDKKNYFDNDDDDEDSYSGSGNNGKSAFSRSVTITPENAFGSITSDSDNNSDVKSTILSEETLINSVETSTKQFFNLTTISSSLTILTEDSSDLNTNKTNLEKYFDDDDDDDEDNYSGSGDYKNFEEKKLDKEEFEETDKDFDDYLDVVPNHIIKMNLTNINHDYFIIVDGYDYPPQTKEKEVDKINNTVI